MKRKEFLKQLGLIGVTTVIAPTILAGNKQRKEYDTIELHNGDKAIISN